MAQFCYRNKKPCSVLYNLRLEFQCMCPIILFGPKHSENFCSVGGNLRPVTISWVPCRGGMSPNFSSPSRARALSVEPEPIEIALEPSSSQSFLLIRMLKFEFEPTSSLLKIRLAEPRAWGLFTESQNFGPGLRACA